MKKNLLNFCIASLFLCTTSIAQQRQCASHEVYQKQITENPSFAQKQRDIESYTQAYIANGGSMMQAGLAQRGAVTYNIPVVVHVLYNTTAQNISDAQVQSQIDVLNKDFQLNNADTTKIPAAFKLLMADCKIQFLLSKKRPKWCSNQWHYT